MLITNEKVLIIIYGSLYNFTPYARLAQLGRARALQAWGRRFKPVTGHHLRRITQEAEGVCLENREAGDEPVRGFKSYILRHMPESYNGQYKGFLIL